MPISFMIWNYGNKKSYFFYDGFMIFWRKKIFQFTIIGIKIMCLILILIDNLQLCKMLWNYPFYQKSSWKVNKSLNLYYLWLRLLVCCILKFMIKWYKYVIGNSQNDSKQNWLRDKYTPPKISIFPDWPAVQFFSKKFSKPVFMF